MAAPEPVEAAQNARPAHSTPAAPAMDVQAGAEHGAAARLIARSRYAALVAVAGIILISVTLFLLSALLAVMSAWDVTRDALAGQVRSADVKVEFFKIVTLTLKAVVFYVIAGGLYELFIGRLPGVTAIHVDSLNDLEKKVVSAIIVILATTFLERFTIGGNTWALLREGAALALVIGALVLFQFFIIRDEQLEQGQGGGRR